MNTQNFGIAAGRLTKDPVIFDNKDGSRKVMLTVAAQDNFKGKDGKRNTQFIPLEGFIPASRAGNGVYDYMHKGDRVSIEYTVRTNNYTDKDGNAVYSTVLFVQSVDLTESKSAQAARAAAQAQAEEPAPAKTAKKRSTKTKKASEDAPFVD